MNIDEMIAVMEHYKNGGKVQVKLGTRWRDDNEPKWDWDMRKYRIKPEPKVIPWTFENAPISIKILDNDRIIVLYLTTDEKGFDYQNLSKNISYTFNYLAKNKKQLDGSPCGTIEKNCHDCVNCVDLKCTKPTCKNYEYFDLQR